MEIQYKTNHIEKLCCNPIYRRKKLSPENAAKLLETLNMLLYAPNLNAIPRSFDPHPIQGCAIPTFSVDLHKGHRVWFEAIGDDIYLADHGVDRLKVTIIRISEIANIHPH
ncbi:MAG: hypothetical protein ACYC1M_08720 [Armatimonadota bacterium]